MNRLFGFIRTPSKARQEPEDQPSDDNNTEPELQDEDEAEYNPAAAATSAEASDSEPQMASSSSPAPPKKASQPSKSAERSSRARKSSSPEAASSDEEDVHIIEEIPVKSQRKTRSSLAGHEKEAPPSSRRLTRGSVAPSSAKGKAVPSSSKGKNHINAPASSNKKPPSSRRVEVVVDKPSSARKQSTAVREDDEDKEDGDSEPYKPPRHSRRNVRVASSAETDESEVEVEEPAPKRKTKVATKKAAPKKDQKKRGRGKPPGKAPPRRDDTSTEEEDSEDQAEADDDREWSTPPVEDLEGPEFKVLGSLQLRDENDQSAMIKKHDVVEFQNGGVREAWLAVIQKMGGLERDFSVATNDEGEPVIGAKGQVLKQLDIPWFEGAWLYTKDMFLDLPKDSTDWRWAPLVLTSMGKNERIETDDKHWQTKDALACPYYPDTDSAPRSSAVTTFRFNDTYPGVSSSGLRTSHPLRHFRAPAKKEVLPPVPSYFWGDGSGSDSEDEVATAPWVRTSFNFKPTEDAKRRASLKGKGRPDGKAITFNKHSVSRKAYNPSRVQIYGPVSKQWYDVVDLQKGEHYALVNRAQELAGLLDDDSSDSDEDEEEDEDEEDSEPISSSNKKRKHSSSKSKGKADSRKKARLAAIAESPLGQLAKAQIVRGGAYGLIGNSYLVTRAAELVKKVIGAEDSDDEAEAEEEGEQLLEDEKAWKKGVEERKKRGLDAGAPPKGQQWVCPSI